MEPSLKSLHWKERLSTHDEKLDAEHKQLLDIANDLQRALHEGKADEIMHQHFSMLIRVTKKHFDAEEESMRASNYPGLPQHKAEHDRLIQQVSDLQTQIRQGRKVFSMDIIYFLKHWMMYHIVTEDAAFGLHLEKHRP